MNTVLDTRPTSHWPGFSHYQLRCDTVLTSAFEAKSWPPTISTHGLCCKCWFFWAVRHYFFKFGRKTAFICMCYTPYWRLFKTYLIIHVTCLYFHIGKWRVSMFLHLEVWNYWIFSRRPQDIPRYLCGDQNRYFKPNQDVFSNPQQVSNLKVTIA